MLTEGLRVQPAQTETLCQKIRERVQNRIGANRYRIWFGDTTVFQLDDQLLSVHVTNPFAGKWIASNYLDDLLAVTRDVLPDADRVNVQIHTRRVEAEPARHPLPMPPGAAATANGRATARSPKPGNAPLRGELDDFVVGPGNAVAFAAAQSMVRSVGRAFKLLVLHGGVGLGKTHLIHGVCNALRRADSTIECRYISGEEFTNEFIAAVKSGRVEAFRARFRNVDVLAVDDIHFLANKKATQDEFLHTFNAIDACGRSVVLTSDRHPRTIATLTEPLIDRLIAGTVVQIDPPDYSTRREILVRRARTMNQDVPAETLDYIAGHVTRNIRELEGALYTLTAYASLMRQPLTVEAAQAILAEHVNQSRRSPDVREIERVVGQRFGVSPEQIRSRSRDRTVSAARAVVMYLVRKHTALSFPEIGRSLGKKNHSTVLMAVQRIEALLARDGDVAWRVGAESQVATARTLIAELECVLMPNRH